MVKELIKDKGYTMVRLDCETYRRVKELAKGVPVSRYLRDLTSVMAGEDPPSITPLEKKIDRLIEDNKKINFLLDTYYEYIFGGGKAIELPGTDEFEVINEPDSEKVENPVKDDEQIAFESRLTDMIKERNKES